MNYIETAHTIRTAVLLLASPEYVYTDLIKHRSVREWWEGHSDLDELDTALLARNDPLITLAVAETTRDDELVRKIYGSIVSDTLTCPADATYKAALRLACLSNANEKALKFADAIDFFGAAEFERIVTNGGSAEVNALLRNPSFEKLIPHVLERKGVFATIDDQRWCSLVDVTAGSDRLTADDSSPSGPDMYAWDIQKAIVRFACNVPVSERGARTLIRLLRLFHGHIFAESKSQHDALFSRWQGWDYKKEEEREHEWTEDLKSEVIALLGAVVYAYSTKDEKGKFGSVNVSNLNSNKLSERCGYYSIMQLKEPQMEVAYQKDHQWFVESAIRNPSVMYEHAKRTFIEEHLPVFLNWFYRHQCDVYAKKRKDFSATPVTTDLRREFNLPEPVTEIALDALAARALALESSLEKLKHWVLWIGVGLAALILWTAHR